MNIKHKLRNCTSRMWQFLAARPICRRANELMFDLAVRGLGIANYQNESVSGEKYLINKILPRYCGSTPPVCVDVGANEGGYARLLLRRFPEARIFCIEPHSANYKKLSDNIQGKAKLLNVALGSIPGKLVLYDRADAEGHGSEHATFYQNVITRQYKLGVTEHLVEVQTLDKLAREWHIDASIDLLKIDVEGHELEVLRGCAELLGRRSVQYIQLEFNQMNVISRVFLRDIRDLLSGYYCFRMLPSGLLPLSEKPLKSELFGFQNLLFIKQISKV